MRRFIGFIAVVGMFLWSGMAYAGAVNLQANGTQKGSATTVNFASGFDVTRSGTIATINYTGTNSTPTVTGGTINGAVIGGSSPAAGHFTTLSTTGAATIAAGTATLSTLTVTGITTLHNVTRDGTFGITNANVTSIGTLASGNVTISSTAVTAASEILFSYRTVNGTAGSLWVPTINAGTNFTVRSTAGLADNSTFSWMVTN